MKTYADYNPDSNLTYEKVMVAMKTIKAANQLAPPPLKVMPNPILGSEDFQTFIPRSKKKRIIKKCKKKYTVQRPSRTMYLLREENVLVLVCHPQLLPEVKSILQRAGTIPIAESPAHDLHMKNKGYRPKTYSKLTVEPDWGKGWTKHYRF